MFYSMMSESTMQNNNHQQANTQINLNRTQDILNNTAINNNNNNSTLLHDSIHSTYSNNSTTSEADRLANDLDHDKTQLKFRQKMHQTIDDLKNDVVLVNNKSNSNLFQTFKIKFRMLTLTVLHTDPINEKNNSNNNINSTNNNPRSSSTKFLLKNTIVDRMKHISDNYFDYVSTIETTTSFSSASSSSSSSSSSNSTQSIEKNIIQKYHQACAFYDHFLLLLKPINLNLVQKINQHNHYGDSNAQKYSLNDLQLSVGYLQANEYLINDKILKMRSSQYLTTSSNRYKYAHIIEASQHAQCTEFFYFEHQSSNQSTNQELEQPCLKIDLIFYEPFNNKSNNSGLGADGSRYNLLSKSFQNIQVHFNYPVVVELDFSIIDRLYYILNDISKTSTTPNRAQTTAATQNQSLSIQNIEVKCLQLLKIALRFPIADLRQNKIATEAKKTSTTAQTGQKLTCSSSLPTMINFKRLREQILTIHIFDFHFQTILNLSHSDLLLNLTLAQANLYYQYIKKDRPIHFALIQENEDSRKAILFSIKIPNQFMINDSNANTGGGIQILLNDNFESKAGMSFSPEQDSLKHIIDRANRFYSGQGKSFFCFKLSFSKYKK
jgi:hypothetical protein